MSLDADGTKLWLDLRRLHPRQEVLLVLLQATLQQLELAEVPCWATGGTLLGALRHGGFVPHDDDIDLECLEADAARIEAAFTDHPRLAYRRGGQWKETPVAHIGLRGTDVELDIFLREEALNELPDFPSSAEVFPLQRYPFHGLELAGPGAPSPFLARLYGPDCLETVRVWSHDFNNAHGLAHDPNRVTLSIEDYNTKVAAAAYRQPALPATSAKEEAPSSEAALEAIFQPGGAVEALRAARDETWLETLQRRNREQAEAQLRLSGKAEDAALS